MRPSSVAPASLRPSGLDPDVRACLSPNAIELGRGKEFYEVSRAQGALGTFVHVAIADPDDRAAEVESALLLFRANGPCVSMLDYEGVFYSFEEGAPDDVESTLLAAFDRWLVDWQRGVTP